MLEAKTRAREHEVAWRTISMNVYTRSRLWYNFNAREEKVRNNYELKIKRGKKSEGRAQIRALERDRDGQTLCAFICVLLKLHFHVADSYTQLSVVLRLRSGKSGRIFQRVVVPGKRDERFAAVL